MIITLNNTKGTRCEVGDMLILSKHMNSSPFFIGHCCWISFYCVCQCLLLLQSNNCCRENHGAREITLDEMKFEASLRHFIKQIHIPFGHHFKYSILFTFIGHCCWISFYCVCQCLLLFVCLFFSFSLFLGGRGWQVHDLVSLYWYNDS
jgi:hypothetical protein